MPERSRERKAEELSEEAGTVGTARFTVAQSKLRSYVSWSRDREFRRSWLSPADQNVNRNVDRYQSEYKTNCQIIWMSTEKLSLPMDVFAGTVDMLEVLPNELVHFYRALISWLSVSANLRT